MPEHKLLQVLTAADAAVVRERIDGQVPPDPTKMSLVEYGKAREEWDRFHSNLRQASPVADTMVSQFRKQQQEPGPTHLIQRCESEAVQQIKPTIPITMADLDRQVETVKPVIVKTPWWRRLWSKLRRS
jgi:hypothetical protein